MTAAEIVAALGGRGHMARCPAHDDTSPSLNVAERDGKLLVHCFAGCSQANVISALRSRGLWPERKQPLTSADRIWLAREYVDNQRIREEAAYFAETAALMAEWALAELSPADPERAVHTALLAALRVSPEAEYRSWLARDPNWAAALVHAGRERAKRLQIALARWIAAGMLGVADAA